ncbi:ribulose 1,5-bisphosphate carboxylase large subunit [PVC group bacterium]|nr:ribulose 1,5-bisphosphate carboxylase large subunit [PVC group bacterium]
MNQKPKLSSVRYDVSLPISGQRISAVYRVEASSAEIQKRAEDICVEQTIEFPAELVTSGDIREHILGRIEGIELVREGTYQVVISYAVEIIAGELTQLLNVVYGNISIKSGIRLERLDAPDKFWNTFKGPRFGVAGLRRYYHVPDRPLLATALKPLGLGVEALSELAYQYALGGIDIIKDDHGITDQSFAPFKERVTACGEAVQKANKQTGARSVYVPSITAPADQIFERARFAKKAGAGGVMIVPGLVGFDTMRCLADDDSIGLPVFSHPSWLGCFAVNPDHGIAPGALLSQFVRISGADVTIFPHAGGRRFSMNLDDCKDIKQECAETMGHFRSIFPAPGGGMSLERIPEMKQLYGNDVIFLIGGDLHRRSPDLVSNCRAFRDIVEKIS